MGLHFATQAELDEYLKRIEEAKKRDHRSIGVKLDLFTFSDLVGSGLPLYDSKRGSDEKSTKRLCRGITIQ